MQWNGWWQWLWYEKWESHDVSTSCLKMVKILSLDYNNFQFSLPLCRFIFYFSFFFSLPGLVFVVCKTQSIIINCVIEWHISGLHTAQCTHIPSLHYSTSYNSLLEHVYGPATMNSPVAGLLCAVFSYIFFRSFGFMCHSIEIEMKICLVPCTLYTLFRVVHRS